MKYGIWNEDTETWMYMLVAPFRLFGVDPDMNGDTNFYFPSYNRANRSRILVLGDRVEGTIGHVWNVLRRLYVLDVPKRWKGPIYLKEITLCGDF
jgi:hypothetical protein